MDEQFMRVQARLTDRDHVLLGWLADHGVLTTVQINHALFGSLDFTQRRLRKLCHAGLLARFRPFRAEGGTYPYHYVLAQLGVEVVAAHRGEDLPRKDQARKRRWHLTNRANLPHLLAVNQFFTDLAGHARTHPEASLDRWWPASRFQGQGALAQPGDPIQVFAYTTRVRPDGHGIWTEHGLSLSFFAEIDTGTEPLPVLVDKVDGYLHMAGVTGRIWPVLFWLHSALRERHLHTRLTEAGVVYPVATATRDTATQQAASPADDIWWLHRHAGARQRLVSLADDDDAVREMAC
ncbi:replication-relaxation family protein [Solwaraspora sp. WMMD1047]|uniref:replication-relaxation family protein n=1 Tax=Solwaraspora sp. WMMD1047 TaxID=3016102 RepID=UPI00241718AD|nr:replication-relaxation family protein [Solwaraspora sp. WMMD1047]MDG4833989.1 replication-relaxation family protein [Solwaraspora sp. WMMD1047]